MYNKKERIVCAFVHTGIRILKNTLSYKFFLIWSFFIPITSFVLLPSVKGSLISYIMAFISPIIVISCKKIRKKYFCDFCIFIFIWLFFLMISQLSNSIWNINISSLILLDSNDFYTKVFRDSIFSQSLYLLPCIFLFLYTKYFYNEKWDIWIIYSGLVFSIIGLFFFVYFLFTGQNADFISNRIVGENNGSWYQYVIIGNLLIQRIQGLSGEPSMYAFILLPYLIFSIHRKANKSIIFIMGLSLILTTSTSGYLGILVYLFCLLYFNRINIRYLKYILISISICCVIYIIFKDYIDGIIMNAIINKLTNLDDPNNVSGIERSANIYGNIIYWLNLDIMHMLFGIGFGVIRSTDLFSTFLINIGIVGTILFSYFYLKNIKRKNITFKDIGDNSILLVLFVVAMVSVPEFSFLSFWLFLGIIYHK